MVQRKNILFITNYPSAKICKLHLKQFYIVSI